MRSATAIPSTPFSRKRRAAAASTRARFASAASLLMRIAAFPSARPDLNDDLYHHSIRMAIIIVVSSGSAGVIMLASLVAKRLARANIHYGWVVAAVAFLTMLATSGAVGLPGALILP